MIACCYLLHPSASHAASHAGGPISAAILQGWVTAISTAVLAIFAIVTAIYAIRAFPLCQTRLRHRSEVNLLLSRARQEPPRRDYDDDRHGVGRCGA